MLSKNNCLEIGQHPLNYVRQCQDTFHNVLLKTLYIHKNMLLYLSKVSIYSYHNILGLLDI